MYYIFCLVMSLLQIGVANVLLIGYLTYAPYYNKIKSYTIEMFAGANAISLSSAFFILLCMFLFSDADGAEFNTMDSIVYSTGTSYACTLVVWFCMYAERYAKSIRQYFKEKRSS